MKRPIPLNKEIKLGKEIIVSKTDQRGVITYGNDVFVKVSGYDLDELINTNHNILRHPDMPKAVFALLWDKIRKGENITAVVKNLSKSGAYYWVITDFEIQKDDKGKIRNYVAFRRAAPKEVVKVMEPIYANMLNVEQEHGMSASANYLFGLLDDKHMNYNEFIEDLSKPKGLKGLLFNKMKKLFS